MGSGPSFPHPWAAFTAETHFDVLIRLDLQVRIDTNAEAVEALVEDAVLRAELWLPPPQEAEGITFPAPSDPNGVLRTTAAWLRENAES